MPSSAINLALILSAIKAKSPIVGIPVEGCEPLCVDRRRLATWCKGVTLHSATIEQRTSEWRSSSLPYSDGPKWYPKGTTVSLPVLVLTGWGKSSTVRAKFASVTRAAAKVTLAEWAPKEAARHQKKRILGTLSTDQKRALKRAAIEDDGEGMVEVQVAMPGAPGKSLKMGTPVVIPELPGIDFVTVRFGGQFSENVRFTVTEMTTGMAYGDGGPTAEAAYLSARRSAAKLNANQIVRIYNLAAGALTC